MIVQFKTFKDNVLHTVSLTCTTDLHTKFRLTHIEFPVHLFITELSIRLQPRFSNGKVAS